MHNYDCHLFTAWHEYKNLAFDVISDKRKEKIQFLWKFTNHITLKSKKKKHHLKSDIILVAKKENKHKKPDWIKDYTECR